MERLLLCHQRFLRAQAGIKPPLCTGRGTRAENHWRGRGKASVGPVGYENAEKGGVGMGKKAVF